ncbi:phosphohydrolase [Mesorhizobium sp. LNHC220B00]|nr:metallophosphoesterase [Mesorhizobium sp. LNHC220B00]ESY85780.1 phosphohydrolase [Mesorhizobium sp. LNHC220B00]
MLLLHLSDIHFSNRDINKPYDQNLGLRDDTVDDIKKMRADIGKDVGAILISGDIAYHGQQHEYGYAADWLRDELCPAAGCRFEDIFVIPGNHDVDRKAAAEPIHEDARKALRANPIDKSNAAIRRYVDSEASSEMLFKPIENYNRFAAKFLCEVGFYHEDTGQKPYAVRDFPLNDRSTLRMWGFNSVLVCDAADDVNKMFVDPSAAEIIRRDDGVTHLVMCHHPFNWLRNSAEFQNRIEAVSKIQLFGHEHNLRVDDFRRFTRIKAGALHPERDEQGWQPGYNFIDLSVSGRPTKRVLEIKLWVRHLLGTRYIAVPDLKGRDPWILDHELGPWSPPEPSVAPAADGIDAVPSTTEEGAMTHPAPTVRSVAIKILALREFDQRKIITELGLHEDGDQRLPDYAFAIAAVRRADERGELTKLNEVIDRYMGGRN